MSIKKQVGAMIRDARKSKRLTQSELGDKLGITKSVVSRYEKGEQNITIETMERIGEVLGAQLLIRYQ